MASKTETCKIPITGSQSVCILNSEWANEVVKLLLLHDNRAWGGTFQVSGDEDFSDLIDQLSLTEHQYMEETKRALTTQGGAQDFFYTIENNVFTWKKSVKNMTIKFGYVTLENANVCEVFERMIDNILESNIATTETLAIVHKKKESLEEEMSGQKKGKFYFSDEEDDKLIEAVALRPCVYDLKHILYKDQRVKDNTWVIISEEVGRSVADCKKRWKNVKDTYDKRNRGISRTGSEAPPSKKSKREWALQGRLSFLRATEEIRQSFCNITEETAIDDDNIDEPSANTSVSSPIQTNHVSSPRSNAVPDVTDRITSLHPDGRCATYAGSKPISKDLIEKKKKPNYRDSIAKSLEKRSQDRHAMIKTLLSTTNETDEIDLFFQSISKTVKKFTPYLKLRAKLETLQLISNMEMEMLSSADNYGSLADPSSQPLTLYVSPTESTSSSTTGHFLCGIKKDFPNEDAKNIEGNGDE